MVESPRHPSQPSDDFARLRRTPAFKLTLLLLLLTSFGWGMYLEINRQAGIFPFGVHMRNDLGFVAYTLSALLSFSLSGTVLQKGLRDSEWNRSDVQVFYGGILLGLLFQLSGFEFLLFGEWRYEDPIPYLVLKAAVVLGFTAFLAVVWNQERRTYRPPSTPPPESQTPDNPVNDGKSGETL